MSGQDKPMRHSASRSSGRINFSASSSSINSMSSMGNSTRNNSVDELDAANPYMISSSSSSNMNLFNGGGSSVNNSNSNTPSPGSSGNGITHSPSTGFNSLKVRKRREKTLDSSPYEKKIASFTRKVPQSLRLFRAPDLEDRSESTNSTTSPSRSSVNEDGENKKFFIKVECLETVRGEAMKEVKIVEVLESTTVHQLLTKCCKRFCKWEDWRYGLYSQELNNWLQLDSNIFQLGLKEWSVIRLQIKNIPYYQSAGYAVQMNNFVTYSKGFNLFSKAGFEKKYKRGAIYIGIIMFNVNHQILMTPQNLLPSMMISKEYGFDRLVTSSDDFLWALRESQNWISLPYLQDSLDGVQMPPLASGEVTPRHQIPENEFDDDETTIEPSTISSRFSRFSLRKSIRAEQYVEEDESSSADFAKIFHRAVDRLKRNLYSDSLGVLYEEAMYNNEMDTTFLLTTRYCNDPDQYVENLNDEKVTLRWKEVDKLDASSYDMSWPIFDHFQDVHNAMLNRMGKGLYVSIFHTVNRTNDGVHVLVPKLYRHMIPAMKIRDDPNLTQEEWTMLQGCTAIDGSFENFEDSVLTALDKLSVDPSLNLEDLEKSFCEATERLKKSTKLRWKLVNLYTKGVVDVDEQCQIRMIVFVKILGFQEDFATYSDDYVLYPLTHFEVIHNFVYRNQKYTEFRRKLTQLDAENTRLENEMRKFSKDPQDHKGLKAQIDQNKIAISLEKEKWREKSWILSLLEWHRTSQFSAQTIFRT